MSEPFWEHILTATFSNMNSHPLPKAFINKFPNVNKITLPHIHQWWDGKVITLWVMKTLQDDLK